MRGFSPFRSDVSRLMCDIIALPLMDRMGVELKEFGDAETRLPDL